MNYRTPVLLLVFVSAAAPLATLGQTTASSAPAAAPTAPSQNAASSSSPAPAKKVWTNDDVTDLRDQSVISTVGGANTRSSTASQKPASKGKDARWYREQIGKLQAKIPPLDDQIVALQAAIDGKPTGNARESARPRGVKADSWPVEMDELRKQRDAVLSQISALYDDARHNGIPDAALPVQP
jgi:hypothetical protein